MTVREREGEHRSEQGCCDTVQSAMTGHRKLELILMERLRWRDWLEQMHVPPDRERTTHLLIAESPPGDIAVVPHRPADACRTDAERERDSPAVADPALLLLDSHQRRRS